MNDCGCFKEIERLHQFFSDWFVGRVDTNTFGYCESALAPDFTMVMPDGCISDRHSIVEAIRGQYGARDDSFSIQVAPVACQRIGDVHVTRYEEHHHGPDPSRRISTAVLTQTVDGYEWRTVHETWLQDPPTSSGAK
ncbi:MAG: DUF4440 domain-containing protein [Acidimicrobiia bacterium]